MNHAKRRNFLIRQTCIVVLLGIFPLAYIGFLIPLHWFLGGIAFVIICVLLLRQGVKRQEKIYSSILDKTFESFQKPKPTLEIRHGYGFPHFTVTFQSEDDMNVAEASGHLNSFKSTINEICGHYGSKKRPFNVEWAVSVTYVGRSYF